MAPCLFELDFTDSPGQTCAVGLLVGGDGAGFIVVDIENCVELCELEDVLHLLGKVEELEAGALVLCSGVGADELSKSGAVDIVHVAEVEQDALRALADQVTNGLPQLHTPFAEGAPPAEVQDSDSVLFTGSDSKCHGCFVLCESYKL